MRRIVLLAVLVAAPAAAQKMPDARDMSGMSRPDSSVPAGEVTVKVVHGEVGAIAEAGVPVHLVGVKPDGSLTLVTQKVNEEGRAEFTGLATDGRTVYWALCLLGEDRLLSEQISVPPKVGIRMVLAGRRLDRDGKPVGPPADDEKDKAQEPKPLPPAGEVRVVVHGRAAAHAKVALRRVGSDAAPQTAELGGATDEPTATFTGVAGGADAVYVAEIASEGHTYRSTPFMMAGAGVNRTILAHDKLLLAIQGGAQVDDDDMGFEMQLVVANLTGVPFDTGHDGVLLPLPHGFTSGTIKDDDPAKRTTIESGAGVRLRGVVPPGQKEITVQFALPIRDGRVAFEMDAPLGIFSSSMFIAKTAQMVLAPRAGLSSAPKTEKADDGREYYALADIQVAPGSTLAFDVAGLPIPDRWQAWARAIAGAIVIVLVALAVLIGARRPRSVRRVEEPAQLRRELYARRDRLYAELVALERARATGRIEAVAFDAQRKGIMTKLVLVHRELDELDSPPGAGGGAPPGSQAQT